MTVQLKLVDTPLFTRPFDADKCLLTAPLVERVPGYEHWWVARDDALEGGTKQRVLWAVADALGWQRGRPLVYAGPAQGGMQVAVASLAGSDAHLFYGERRVKGLHPRQQQTLNMGAQHHYSPYPSVRPTQVKKLARVWAHEHDAINLAWGLRYTQVEDAIAQVYRNVAQHYGHFDEVWVAAGSGTLGTGLYLGARMWEGKQRPHPRVHMVPIGRSFTRKERDYFIGIALHDTPKYPMDTPCKLQAPFPCDPYYDGKAWEYAVSWCEHIDAISAASPFRRRLFWNVIAPPSIVAHDA